MKKRPSFDLKKKDPLRAVETTSHSAHRLPWKSALPSIFSGPRQNCSSMIQSAIALLTMINRPVYHVQSSITAERLTNFSEYHRRVVFEDPRCRVRLTVVM